MKRYTKDDAKVLVTVNGIDYEGWLESSIERSIENLASRFTIPVTYIPGKRPNIHRQDIIKVWINETLVVTGYVLGADPFYRYNDCGIKIEGRSLTGDLVAGSAIHKGGQWRNAKVDQIARDLCKPFGITAAVETDVGQPLADFSIEHGETVLSTLSRAARMRGLLVTANMRGQLLLTKAGNTKSHGAIVRGQNVITMEGVGTDADRFSTYIGYGQKKVDVEFSESMQQKAVVKDPEIKRYLPLIVNADGNSETADMRRLVEHTMRVRRGQAYGLRYRLEGWTFEGKPWEVNTQVPIYDAIAELDGDLWLIAEANSKVDLKDGDVTDILVRPVDAYSTAPIKPRSKKRNGRTQGTEVLSVK
jgi:prophage tail gpP-like protein